MELTDNFAWTSSADEHTNRFATTTATAAVTATADGTDHDYDGCHQDYLNEEYGSLVKESATSNLQLNIDTNSASTDSSSLPSPSSSTASQPQQVPSPSFDYQQEIYSSPLSTTLNDDYCYDDIKGIQFSEEPLISDEDPLFGGQPWDQLADVFEYFPGNQN